MAAKIHPAITVNNIKNFIPITLEMNKTQYSSWVELFKYTVALLQWIYETISNYLLLPILKLGQSAEQARERLKSMFQDNQNSRAIYLKQKFSNTKQDDFLDISSYCQALKIIFDKLIDVGSKMEEKQLVL
ncbi:uncharacterized protein [Rutidosis leptorrhynchoides]|uniref:uncharacterized protein n=1 Tax=Rutidosis leptorrhynchoides TaxID=125765 RepID=UPI003A9A4645